MSKVKGFQYNTIQYNTKKKRPKTKSVRKEEKDDVLTIEKKEERKDVQTI